ncbi:unnamed protein product [Symbiodinium natans]|uniref:JmjC domain-containing protein n=1 Tax=Symbiodinium natans TaxID=878477 RepID=A0A812LS58_9DINO|nr:unnamed protein product [Symbiodinium natans]
MARAGTCLAWSLALVAAWAAFLATNAGQWQLQRTLTLLWMKFGTDGRLRRRYEHSFPGFGPYNFSVGAWPPIERRSLASLSSQEFEERYVKARRPVILTDVAPENTWSPKTLKSRCGQMPLTFHRRYSAGLRAIPARLRKLFLDSRLMEAYNQTTDDVIQAMHRQRSMKEYVADLPLDAQIIAKGKSHSGVYKDQIVDYIFPVMVSAQEFYESACPDLFAEGSRVLKRLLAFAADGRPNSPQFKQMYPVLFVAPQGSRAIPLHQHGPYNDNLLWMLHGSKRVVVAAPSSTEFLYERPEFGGSEYADRVFSADLVQPDAGRQPNVARVRGMEGVVGAGELIYLPVNTPHAVQTTESSPSAAS